MGNFLTLGRDDGNRTICGGTKLTRSEYFLKVELYFDMKTEKMKEIRNF